MWQKSEKDGGVESIYPRARTWSLGWPELCLLALGISGLGLAQVVAYYGTSSGKSSNSFSQTADYRVFAILLGAGYSFCIAITPIAWSISKKSRALAGPYFKIRNAIITLILVSIAILSLPFIPRVPQLPQIARWQHWRTDFTTLLTLCSVIAPSTLGIVAVRSYAQQSDQLLDRQELLDVVGTLRKHLRFYLIILAIAIAVGVTVLASLRSAVANGLKSSHLEMISSVFPTGIVVLY